MDIVHVPKSNLLNVLWPPTPGFRQRFQVSHAFFFQHFGPYQLPESSFRLIHRNKQNLCLWAWGVRDPWDPAPIIFQRLWAPRRGLPRQGQLPLPSTHTQSPTIPFQVIHLAEQSPVGGDLSLGVPTSVEVTLQSFQEAVKIPQKHRPQGLYVLSSSQLRIHQVINRQDSGKKCLMVGDWRTQGLEDVWLRHQLLLIGVPKVPTKSCFKGQCSRFLSGLSMKSPPHFLIHKV